MRLFQKGILLIAIPIVGQFAFVLFLVTTYRASEELAWKDMHYRTQTQELIGITVLMYKAVVMLSVYGMSNEEEQSLKQFDELFEDLQRKAELLTLLDQGPPEQTATSLQTALKRLVGDLYSTRQMLSDTSGRGPALVLLLKDVKREIETTLIHLEKLIAERGAEGAKSTAQLERSRWIFLASIIGGFSINMLLAAYLLIRYARDFAKRFNIVVDNAKRVPSNAPLNQLIEGKDELARLDRTFHEMYDALKEAEARKQQLMNMVSHDLKGPLSSVQITLELLLDRAITDVSDNVWTKLREAEQSVSRLSRMTNDLLDFEKLKVGKLDIVLTVIPLDSIIRDCVKELKPILKKEEVEVVTRTNQEEVIADSGRLYQIVVNLLSNAIKFSPPGSEVHIDTSILDGDTEGGDMVKVSVRDFGPGVPESYRTAIFLPFEQVPNDQRSRKGGTGLGLPICKMLVERQGGEIGIVVPDNGGSIFWFTLPIATIEEL